jgi:hypothetical protein
VELVNDLVNMATTDELNAPRRASKMSLGGGSTIDETKSVKFASSTSPTTRASSANKAGSNTLAALTGAQPEEMNTIATIRTLLQYVIEECIRREPLSHAPFLSLPVKVNNLNQMKSSNRVYRPP